MLDFILVWVMVFILDGCSFDFVHKWSKSGISICWRHLVTSTESSNPTILYKYHGMYRLVFITNDDFKICTAC